MIRNIFSRKVQRFRVNFYDTSYKRIRGARVRLKKMKGGEELTEEGSYGSVVFNDLEKGDYEIVVEKDGYEPFTADINIDSEGDFDVTLSKKAPEVLEHEVEIKVMGEDGIAVVALVEFGNMSQRSSHATFSVKEGTHQLKVSHEDYLTFSKSINVKKDIKETVVLKQKPGTLKLSVTTPSGRPIKGAKILVKELEASSDEQGVFTTSLLPGVYSISGQKEMYGPNSETITIRPNRTTDVQMVLVPEVHISGEHKTRLEQALQVVYNAYNEIGTGYDHTLPKYFCEICENIVTLAKQEAEDMENFQSNEAFEQMVEEYVKAVEIAIPLITEGMMERRSLVLYHKANSLAKQDPPPVSLVKQVNMEDVMTKLLHVDKLITEETSKLTIYPAATLWDAAKKILDEPSKPKAQIANVILEAVKYMFHDPILRKRLEIMI